MSDRNGFLIEVARVNLANAVRRLRSAEQDVRVFQMEVNDLIAEIVRLSREQHALPNNAGEGEV